MNIPTISWVNGSVKIIDQTVLPNRLKFIICRDTKSLFDAIRRLSVRGAPAIGVAAAFGVLLSMKEFKGKSKQQFIKHVLAKCRYFAKSRPTAVNLFNMLDRMKKVLDENRNKTIMDIKRALKKEAFAIYNEDKKFCRDMGEYGSRFIKPNSNIMTVCNAGALATVDYGTALGVMYRAKEKGRKFKVFACETRPLLQGARLTAWELLRKNIKTTLICDNMAATLMKQNRINAIFTGADRVASNGDAANKIGTYNLAVLAKYHKVPFYIVAPRSTFDMKIAHGNKIPIEERSDQEVKGFQNVMTAPKNVDVYNPAFDVTPHRLITAIVTEAGVIKPVNKTNVKKCLKNYPK